MVTEVRVALNDEEVIILEELKKIIGSKLGRGRTASTAQVIRMLIIKEGMDSGIITDLTSVSGEDKS